ncbi:MAG: hypothetical protein H0W66_06230 [Chthoniobacterales bacterium]|nr:hypothetical protein [Chthoniobacterales bacterium]
MKKVFAALFVALTTLPLSSFACGGGDCSGMELPPPPVPVPGQMENIFGVLSNHAGLMAGLGLAALIAALLARTRKLEGAQPAAPTFAGNAS